MGLIFFTGVMITNQNRIKYSKAETLTVILWRPLFAKLGDIIDTVRSIIGYQN